MDVTSTLDAPCTPAAVFAAVADLSTYPEWLSIVVRAEPAPPASGDGGPAWVVDLRGRMGPLARSKRLRMARTVFEAPAVVRFERREVDGRTHAPWVLDAEVRPQRDHGAEDAGASLTMRLHYGGTFSGLLIERMLRPEIESSRGRLLARLTGRRG